MTLNLPINYTLRDYQKPLWNYLVNGGDRACCNWHRRAGKDLLLMNWISFCACVPPGTHKHARVGTYWHVFPEFNHGRRAIWDTTRSDGFKYLKAFPEELIESCNNQEMRISLKNGSVYQIIGGDQPDRLRGANPAGIIFSEYAFSDAMSKAWATIAPILLENKGWAVFISTPKGENHFYDLFKYAKSAPRWFSETLTVKDTSKVSDDGSPVPVITEADIQEMVDSGEINASDVPQEFHGSFIAPLDGAYYGDYITAAESGNPIRITNVPWEPLLPVYTAWDLGINDNTVIIFFQVSPAGEVRIIECIHDKGEGFAYYLRKLRERDYVYESHFFPWDMEIRENTSGLSRLSTVRSMGLTGCRVVDKLPVEDGIEAVRNILPKCWFDESKTKTLIRAMKDYTKDSMKKGKEHWASDFADAFRYLAVSQRRFGRRGRVQQGTSSKREYAVI